MRRIFPIVLCACMMTHALKTSGGEGVMLTSPGLRPALHPSIVVPATRSYANISFKLPAYKDEFGRPAEGWSMKLVKTRSLSTDGSARLYYRDDEHARAVVFREGERKMVSWPDGALLILEVFGGDGASDAGDKPKELKKIEAMLKAKSVNPHYLSSDWSYAVFAPDGKSVGTGSERIRECHACHAAAFYISGDMVFTNLR